MASGINSTFRQVGIATGIAGARRDLPVADRARSWASCCRRRRRRSRRRSRPAAAQSALASVPPQFRAQAADAANHAFISGLNEILLVGAAIALVGGVASWALVRGRDMVAVPRRPAARGSPSAGAAQSRRRPAERRSGANPSAPAAKTGAVLLELRIENLLLIERAELRLGEGLNAITGETGAGKTCSRTRSIC